MVQLMKNLGITDDNNYLKENIDIVNRRSNRIENYSEVSTFLKDIYINCKNIGIEPTIVFSWIKDLFDCYFPSNISSSFIKIQKIGGIEDDKKPIISNLKMSVPFEIDGETRIDYNSNDILDPRPGVNINNILTDFNPNQNDGSFVPHIPFISQISHFITQKKKQCTSLENYKKEIEKNIKTAELKRNQIQFDLEALKQENNYVMHYIDWYYDLKRELQESYSIGINDFERFVSVINAFRKYEFDVPKIIEKYISAISIEDKIEKETNDFNFLYKQKIELDKSASYLQDQVNHHKQTMDTFYKLDDMNLGLKDLKQLCYTILKISKANDISPDNAVSKFLKDIEKNYDDNLRFETKIKEIKEEISLLSNQVFNYRIILQSQPITGQVLSGLLQKGMNEHDIINISHLIEICTSNIDNVTENKNTTNKNISRSEYWKIFTDDLKRYGDIKVAIKEQQAICEKIRKEINHLHGQKQEILKYIQTAISFINTLNNEISYCRGWIDHFKNLNNRINLPSSFLQPFIFIVYKNKRKDDDDESK
jgi:hypothetical protein